MKGKLLLLFCALALSKAKKRGLEEAQAICAVGGSEGVLLTHTNCNQFYICDVGTPVAVSCPVNLLYNPQTEQCDWSEKVDCGDRLIPASDEDKNTDNGTGADKGSCNCRPDEAPSICAVERSDGTLIAHENCNQFFMCVHGRPVEQSCPGTLLYNPYKETCDWPENVDCGDRIPDCNEDGNTDNDGTDNGSNDNGGGDNNGSCNCNPDEAPAICAADGSDGTLIANGNCNQFYMCVHGRPLVQSCPGILLYNPYKETCDWPDNVECGNRIIPDCNEDGNTDNGGTDDGGNDNGEDGNNGSCNCNPDEAPTICAADGSDGTLIANGNCNQFYVCVHGRPVVQSCPGTLLYNPFKEQCDWPENVECGDRIIPDCNEDGNTDNGGTDDGGNDNGEDGNNGSCNCNPDEAPTICAADGSDGTLIANGNCNQFYICVHGRPVVQSCPGTLLYNPYKNQCDWPDNVECGDRIIPDSNEDGNTDNGGTDDGGIDNGGTDNGGNDNGGNDNGSGGNNGSCNCNPDEAPAICAADGSDGTLIANGNCNQFYVCVHGRPVVQSCPGTLLYNPYKEQCDWPDNVECRDRIIPDSNEDGNTDNGGTDDGGIDNGGTDNGGNDNGGNDNGGGGNNGSCNCNPDEAPTICAADGSDGTLIANGNCNQFYVCVHGRPVVQSCPGTLLYNPYKEQCDWPDNVECGDRIIPDSNEDGNTDNGGTDDVGIDNGGTDNGGNDNGGNDNGGGGNNGSCNCNPDEAPTICAADGSDGTLIANGNCNQFYVCVHGRPVVQSCPGTLLYNPYKEQCDWPDNVECGDRIIPDCNEDGNTDNGGTDDGGIDNGGTDNGGNDNGGNDNGGGGNNGSCNCNPDEAPTICAADGSDGTLIANGNCNQFYMCVHGRPVVQSCPGTLLYNPYKEQCDWPENVECGDRIIPDSSEDGNTDNGGTDDGGIDNGGSDNGDNDNGEDGNNGSCNCNPDEAPEICAADGSDGTLIANGNCNQFYMCIHGQPVVQSCPGTLLYNPYKEQCDWPENVECGDRINPDCNEDGNTDNGGTDDGGIDNGGTDNGDNDNGGNDNGGGGNNGSCNCNPDEAPAICAADGSDGTLIANGNCNQFYMCIHGQPVVQSCPGTLLYNPYKEQCDWPENVECGDRIIPDCNEDGNTDNGGTDDGGNDNGGNDNGGGGNNGSCNCNPDEAPAICAADGSDGTLIANGNCNQFYMCIHGRPVIQSCPGTLLYNPYKEQCDWPENVECGDRINPDCNEDGNTDNGGTDDGGIDNGGTDNGDNDNGGNDNGGGGNNGSCNCNPDEAPAICAADGSDGTLIANGNCNQFYMCIHGQPVVQSCPGTLLYNPYKEQCDWPDNVECGDRIIPDCNEDGNTDNGGTDDGGIDNGGTDNGDNDNGEDGNNGSCNCNPDEAPAICAADGSDGTLIAHKNCNQFYTCLHGQPVVQSCPGTLLYNPHKENCDWPENVDCGDRIIPDCDEDGNTDNGGTDNGGIDNGGTDSGDNDNGGGGNNGSCNCNPDEAPTICAVDGSDGTLIAHKNCNQFYTCLHGLPVVQSCTGTLLYNPYKELCDWPENVDCGDRINPDCDTDGNTDNGGTDDNDNGGDGNNGSCNCNPDEAPVICAADGSDGTLIAHKNCNQFYTCSHGKPEVQSCPGTLLYNPYEANCDWPENVDCGDRIIPDSDEDGNTDNDGTDKDDNDNGGDGSNGSCNCNPDEAPVICAANGSDGTLIAHKNCNQFYTCSHGEPEVQSCPGTLLYNPYEANCDWPENVDCGDRIIPDSDEDGNTDNDGTDKDDNDNGGDGNNGSCNCNPDEAPVICAANGSDGTLIAHKNCNQFYTCSHGEPEVQSCPGTLLYNPHEANCDWPENVDCGDRIIPDSDEDGNTDNDGTGNGDIDCDNDGTEDNGNDDKDNGGNDNDGGGNNGACNCNPDEAAAICAAEGSDGVLVAHEKCNQFYKCLDGKPIVLTCSDSRLYSPYIEQCDWPQNVNCGNRTITDESESIENDSEETNNSGENNDSTGNADSNNGGSSDESAGDDSGSSEEVVCDGIADGSSVAHESNCNQYYTCRNGLPTLTTCPGILLFNPSSGICDWPANVNCNRRMLKSNQNVYQSNAAALNKHLNGRIAFRR